MFISNEIKHFFIKVLIYDFSCKNFLENIVIGLALLLAVGLLVRLLSRIGPISDAHSVNEWIWHYLIGQYLHG